MGNPDFIHEIQLIKKGHKIIAGADEVGRGAFAGPVVAGIVVFPLKIKKRKYKTPVKIDDSKKLTIKQREKANVWIRENALFWGVGEASVFEINRKGFMKSLHSGFRRAVKNATVSNGLRIDYLLVDAINIPYIRGLPKGRQKAIIGGDGLSFSIAAASIVAKVYRDNLMKSLGKESDFKKYHWCKNKGYGTNAHRNAILEHGICEHHREAFVQTFLRSTCFFS